MFNTHLLPSQLPGESKIVYVVRSGRDVAWSFYNHLSNQIEDGGDDFGSFANFLRLWLNGDLPYSKWVDHLKTWRAYIDSPEGMSRVLLLNYESMKEDLGREMKKIAAHLGLKNLTESDIEGLADSLTFSSMKSDQKKYEPVSVRWRPGYSFLRKGNVGDLWVTLWMQRRVILPNLALSTTMPSNRNSRTVRSTTPQENSSRNWPSCRMHVT